MITEGKYTGEFLLSEGEGAISRESITLKKRAALFEAGTILGVETSSGLYKAFDSTADDGSEIAVAILYDNVDASASNTTAVVIARLAEVDAKILVGDADAAKSLLAQQFIIIR